MSTGQLSVPKNVILLSDGTGNAASKVWRSNVWRLFQALDLTNSRQVAVYDDGVGTSSFMPLAVLGGAFGWGLKRNVLDLYTFLCRNYEPGARIYAFGFSRGAYTIRIVLGLVANQGLVRYTTEEELQRLAPEAYRAYRRARFHSILHVETPLRWLRNAVVSLWDCVRRRRSYDTADNIPAPLIEFVGLWDTVAAYGLPIEEMTRGVSQWIWPLELPDRMLGKNVQRACHALALDDERTTFHPVLWTERGETPAMPDVNGLRWVKDERLSQVWFSGVHSNVGGGYPDDSLAHVSLTWIMKEAGHRDLRFKAAPTTDPDAVLYAASSADKDGRLYDSRRGAAGYYRYGPRKIADLCRMRASRRKDDEVVIGVPKIHESAIDRTVNGAHAYAPIGIPATYAVVMKDGRILEGADNPFESPAQAAARARVQEGIWDLVWWRRVVYFLTLGASFHLALFPIIYRSVPSEEFSTPYRIVSDTVRLVGGFLPAFSGWWIDAFATNPWRFVLALAPLVVLIYTGVRLGRRITGEMHTMWRAILRQRATPAGTAPVGFVHWLRTRPAYRETIRIMKRYVVPLVSAALLVYLGGTALNHLAFDLQDASGAFCRERSKPLTGVEVGKPVEVTFKAAAICGATGIELQEGRRYRITLKEPKNWHDRTHPSPLAGFEIGELGNFAARARMASAIPLRRVLTKPWFRPIARIGAVGTDEYPLDPDTRVVTPTAARAAAPAPDELVAEIRARRSGELFLYVNDAVLAIPQAARYFYDNNRGEATATVSRSGR